MKQKLKILTEKIADLKTKITLLDEDKNCWGYKEIRSAYNSFLIHYEQKRAELLSNLGRK